MNEITIFKFHGHFEGDLKRGDLSNSQDRFFAAKTNEEAWEKLEAYQAKMVADGMQKFVPCGEPEVELDYVFI